jgi:hypothetical protein
LSVSVIPSNIDVWGWKKWYLPKSAKIENVRKLIEGPRLTVDTTIIKKNDMKPLIDHGKTR